MVGQPPSLGAARGWRRERGRAMARKLIQSFVCASDCRAATPRQGRSPHVFALLLALLIGFACGVKQAHAQIVALGASNTYGKGVARDQAYPAQLEASLRAN